TRSMPSFLVRNGWTLWHPLMALLLMALGVMVTWEAWADIFRIASYDEESSQIYLVFPIFAWLVWVRRERLRHCIPRGQFIGVAIMLVGWILTSYGYYNAVQSFWHGGAVLVVAGGFLAVAGKDVLRRFLPAFVVLVFLVPVPGRLRLAIAEPLQGYLAVITQVIFDLLGVEVERAGHTLQINGTQVAIAEACNGLRMVFSLVLVSYGFAFGTPLRNYVRAIIVLASPMSAILTNVVRMIPTVWLYGWSGETVMGMPGDEVANTFHDLAAWPMVIVAFLILMAIIKVLRWALIPVTPYTLARG
ncbi:MAG: exosortase/archaeosortase family protein, partial [Phycisphaeraceae bacterium]